jgi:DNA-directed RNA polymerase subunit RPC12/RpoP
MRDARYNRRLDFDREQYESALSAGIAAVKGGEMEQARQLLTKAVEMVPTDPQAWIWLSGTTQDPDEQRDYLENALVADPNNAHARRGLVMLSEKLDRNRLLREGESINARLSQEPEEARTAQSYLCPNCGGHLRFAAGSRGLACEFCGHITPIEQIQAADTGEQVLDFVLPTTRGHRWSQAQHRMACEQCGAVSLLPRGQVAGECAYCGSRHLIESAETVELVEPNVIGLSKLNRDAAIKALHTWLGRGWTSPDDIKKSIQGVTLRAAYYPFWTFDGTLTMGWSCEVSEGSGNNPRWVPRSGEEIHFFDDVLVPGLKAVDPESIERIKPFDLKGVVEFKPEYLAGWVALSYGVTLAEASLRAREKVASMFRRVLPNRVLLGHEVRNLRSSATKWSGMTFKHVLLPIWTGSYRYQDEEYRFLINAQSGKTTGEQPQDTLKTIALGASGVITVLVIILLLVFIALYFGWIQL